MDLIIRHKARNTHVQTHLLTMSSNIFNRWASQKHRLEHSLPTKDDPFITTLIDLNRLLALSVKCIEIDANGQCRVIMLRAIIFMWASDWFALCIIVGNLRIEIKMNKMYRSFYIYTFCLEFTTVFLSWEVKNIDYYRLFFINWFTRTYIYIEIICFNV